MFTSNTVLRASAERVRAVWERVARAVAPAPTAAAAAVVAVAHEAPHSPPPLPSSSWSSRLRSLAGGAASRFARAEEAPDVPTLTLSDSPAGEFQRRTVKRCRRLLEPFVPTQWMRGAHAQTILGTMLRFRPGVQFVRQRLALDDEGVLALDWDSGLSGQRVAWLDGERLPHSVSHGGTLSGTTGTSWLSGSTSLPTPAHPSSDDSPILLMLPGLTGSSRTKYVCQSVMAAREYGWRAVVFNFRGTGGLALRTLRPSTGVNIEDVIASIEHIRATYPRAPVLVLGFSMGANMLIKALGTLGERRAELGLVAAVAVSCAFDYVRLAESLDVGPNRLLYSRFLTHQLKRNYLGNSDIASLASAAGVRHLDLPSARRAQTIWELDDRFTRHLYGIGGAAPCEQSVREYYDQQSSKYVVRHIRTPTMVLNALDDPFRATVPHACVKDNPCVLLAQTRRGGHVAWTQGMNPLAKGASWMIQTSLEYLSAALTTHQEMATEGKQRES